MTGKNNQGSFFKISELLSDFKSDEDKYIAYEFQKYGYELAKELGDLKNRSLYIKLAKTIPRPVLEEALRFVLDAKAHKKGALFMWKLKQMNAFEVKSVKTSQSQLKSAKSFRK
jgi:hypothetical protein